MLRRIPIILSLVLMAVMAVAPAAMAENKLEGTMDLAWNDCFQGPGETVPDWVGTVDIDGDVYDMVFFNVGSGRPPNHPLPEPLHPFNELYALYDGLEIVYDADCGVETFEGDLVLWGTDQGVTNTETGEYVMAGTVAEAVGIFDGLAGSSVSMDGTIVFGPDGPETAPGTLYIN